MTKCMAYIYDIEEKSIGIYIPKIDLDKQIRMGDQKGIGIERFDYNKQDKSMKLIFSEPKENKKGKRGVKYVAVKKLEGGEVKKTENVNEIIVKVFQCLIKPYRSLTKFALDFT